MLELIKVALRISHSALDNEIMSIINACERDLSNVGIIVDEEDALIIQAVRLYCRWQFNYENQADRYEKAFNSLKISLALSGDYNEQ